VDLNRTVRREATLKQLAARAPQLGTAISKATPPRPGIPALGTQDTDVAADVVAVPLLSLQPGDSPRLNGEDKAHIARLAETEAPLPPILVDRRTMKVIDGMHRLRAASLQGRETIDVVFFDGTGADVFLRAVEENVTHGLPLSLADRRAAVARIIASHPYMSNRAIAQSAGLSARTVAALRKDSSDETPQSNVRVGMDGKLRPLDSGVGRRRAAEFMARQPDAPLREVALAAGISPATVLDVRKRLERGESPVPDRSAANAGRAGAKGRDAKAAAESGDASVKRIHLSSRAPAPSDLAATVQKLLRDPSLRSNERGKEMLRLLHVNAAGAEQLADVAAAVPPHCAGIVMELAHHYANMWHEFARELDQRVRITDPSMVAR
jgi:ParB-like chromosome segregation protein Spo0J